MEKRLKISMPKIYSITSVHTASILYMYRFFYIWCNILNDLECVKWNLSTGWWWLWSQLDVGNQLICLYSIHGNRHLTVGCKLPETTYKNMPVWDMVSLTLSTEHQLNSAFTCMLHLILSKFYHTSCILHCMKIYFTH